MDGNGIIHKRKSVEILFPKISKKSREFQKFEILCILFFG
jgi:hypothetical protein